MPHIFYLPDERDVETSPSETILDASLRSGIPHAHACGGNAKCSTCCVVILEGVENCAARSAKEGTLAERLHFTEAIRLGCQTRISGDVTLRRPVIDEVDVALTSQIRRGAIPGRVGEEHQIAILFSDISGYTPFVAGLPPYDVVHVLNRYFYLMHQVVERNGGHVSDYVGDGIVAFFGIQEPSQATAQAIAAGFEMFEAVDQLNPYLEAMYEKSFQIRIGVHFGEVVVGTIGAGSLKKLAAFGDPVNVASRIETANKEVGTRFLISEEAYAQVRDRVRVSRSVRVPLRGKPGVYELYEVVGLDGDD